MSKSLALCSAGGNFAKHTDKRSGGCEGEVKEKNISEPVFKNEAEPSKGCFDEEQRQRFDYLMSDKFFESTMLSESFPGSGVYGNLDSKLSLEEQSHLLRLLLQKEQSVCPDTFRNKVSTYLTFQQGLEDLDLLHLVDQSQP